MSSSPVPSSPTTGTSRAEVVVDEVVGRVARDGERAFSRVRVGVAGAVALLWPPITMLSADPGALVGVEAVAVVALMISLIMWAALRRQQRTTPLLGLVSVLIDRRRGERRRPPRERDEGAPGRGARLRRRRRRRRGRRPARPARGGTIQVKGRAAVIPVATLA
jgi:hypothetical protein